MRPASRTALPRWEVSLDGVVLGWVQQQKIGRSSSVFYKATGIHPVTGAHVNLENSIDFEERCETVVDFHRRPMEYARFVY